ncbi:phospholysine phosphohistidine inorganic pyrophosphate phosphatase-like [Apostichopus japonicus]|uniref:phospholysine phosphohistidine inorganic pyrophosphate phosphatase-like n=1 Tax=Stichopus japonicus TaxID=307972 RepID=UPI003AB504D6
MSVTDWFSLNKNIEGVLLDISGVLYNSDASGGKAIAGSVEAVKRLKASHLKVRFCTNESQHIRSHLVQRLQGLGFDVEAHEVFSPAPAACQLVKDRGLVPHLLVDDKILPEFDAFKDDEGKTPNCVVIGDAVERFTYQTLNDAFRVLIASEEPLLITLGIGKYYRESGELMMDVGPFTKALEYAADCKAEIVGKPSPSFFQAALKDMGVDSSKAIMIGDDIVNDVGGAQKCGMRGIQVRTGKFRPSDENHPEVKPDCYVDDLSDAVNRLLSCSSS